MKIYADYKRNEYGYTYEDITMVDRELAEHLHTVVFMGVYGLRDDNTEHLIVDENDLKDFEFFGIENSGANIKKLLLELVFTQEGVTINELRKEGHK